MKHVRQTLDSFADRQSDSHPEAHLQVGVSGLFVTLLIRGPLAWVFALILIAGFAAFLSQVAWMLRHPRPRPPGARTPDPAVWHAGAAFASLTIACPLGLWLAIADTSPATLRIAMAYGVFGLVQLQRMHRRVELHFLAAREDFVAAAPRTTW